MPEEIPPKKPEDSAGKKPVVLVQLRMKCPHCQGVLESEAVRPGVENSPVYCTQCKRSWLNYRALIQAKIAANRAQRVGPVDMARLGLEKTRVAIRAGRNVLEGSAHIQEMLVGMFSEFKNFSGLESMQVISEDLEDIAGQALLSVDAIKAALAGKMGPDPVRVRAREVNDEKPARRPRRKRS